MIMRLLEWWRRPARNEQALLRIEGKVDDMALNMVKLKAAVTKITDASDAMQATFKAIADDIRAAGTNEADLDQLANALEKEADEIIAATLAGTAADPAAPVVPVAPIDDAERFE